MLIKSCTQKFMGWYAIGSNQRSVNLDIGEDLKNLSTNADEGVVRLGGWMLLYLSVKY